MADVAQSRWDALLHVTRSWRLEWNIEQLLARVAREALQLLAADRSAIFLLERSGLRCRAMSPADGIAGDAAEIEAIAQKVIHSGRPVYAYGLESTAAQTVKVVLCVPLTASRGILGAMYLELGEQEGRTGKHEEFLQMLGLQAAAAVEHAILYQSAITDPLTRLFSHRHFQQEAEQAVRRSKRSGEPLSMILMDLDHFKELNDACGHEAGNRCLVQVAEILRATLRATDLLARFGGDEFEVLLPDTGIEQAQMVAEKLRPKIAALSLPQGQHVSATLGVAAYPKNACDSQSLFLACDAALYQAKQAGRNQTFCSRTEGAALPDAGISRATFMAVDLNPASSEALMDVDANLMNASSTEKIDGHPVLQRLGTGSSGEVLLVRQPELDREVALKRLLTANLSPEQARLFEREAKITASLRHPGVVTVHTMGRDADGRRYYTMVPIEGTSLADIFVRRNATEAETLRAFSVARLVEVVYRVSETIAYAHQKEVVHLDLTPGNIIVGEFGQVTIIDWGRGASSEKFVGSLPAQRGATHLLVGSPRYMAPEYLPGSASAPGTASDVFALGAILYECLCGRPPYLRTGTRETLEALRRGELIAPEVAAPEEGIDPTLSALCVEALASEPSKRPSAFEFTRRLGVFMRREPEWQVTRFGIDQPLLAEDWLMFGDWCLCDGAWRLAGRPDGPEQVEGKLLWKKPITGSFRFICEAWAEADVELSMIGRAESNELSGYIFQFSAENGCVTKLSRIGENIVILPGLVQTVGRKYRLEMEYRDEEGWLHCYVDGKRVLSYRELFPFAGSHLGFYAFGSGAFLRPVEVHRQASGLRVSAMRLADRQYARGKFVEASEQYHAIAEALPGRLEGQEARLKEAMCCAEQGESKLAREIFGSLRGQALEPFAIAERAVYEMNPHLGGDPGQAVLLFEELLQRFPTSSARGRLLSAARLAANFSSRFKPSRAEDLKYRIALNDLAVRTATVPAGSQVRCKIEALRFRHMLGAWQEALPDCLAFAASVPALQHGMSAFEACLIVTALACGREDLLPAELRNPRGSLNGVYWPTGVLFHYAIRKQRSELMSRLLAEKAVNSQLAQACLLYLLDQERFEEAKAYVERCIIDRFGLPNPKQYRLLYQFLAILFDARAEHLVERFASRYRNKETAVIVPTLRAQMLLEQADVERASLCYNQCEQTTDYPNTVLAPPVHQALFVSLGLGRAPSKELLLKVADEELAGVDHELVQMFFGLREPRPGPLWPHPQWRPELRLWLALWHEQRGAKALAKEIASPALDARYRNSNSQPALRELLKRCQ